MDLACGDGREAGATLSTHGDAEAGRLLSRQAAATVFPRSAEAGEQSVQLELEQSVMRA